MVFMGQERQKGEKRGVCIIDGTGSNVFVRLVSEEGKVLIQLSAGNVGMRGPKKRTSYAAGMTALKLAEKAVLKNYKNVRVEVKGVISKFVKEALRGLVRGGLVIREIKLVMVHAHNGLRAKKAKRR